MPSLEHEVLAMFFCQAVGLMRALAILPADAGELAHKLKGSARAIGRISSGRCAGMAGNRSANGDDPVHALAELTEAVEQARTAIDAILRRS